MNPNRVKNFRAQVKIEHQAIETLNREKSQLTEEKKALATANSIELAANEILSAQQAIKIQDLEAKLAAMAEDLEIWKGRAATRNSFWQALGQKAQEDLVNAKQQLKMAHENLERTEKKLELAEKKAKRDEAAIDYAQTQLRDMKRFFENSATQMLQLAHDFEDAADDIDVDLYPPEDE